MLASACNLFTAVRLASVIRWKLAVVMADRNISSKELASRTGMHVTTLSKLRTRRYPTRIDVDTLNALCEVLECQPGDLLVYEKEKKE